MSTTIEPAVEPISQATVDTPRTVRLYAWYRNANPAEPRSFCVVEKLNRGSGHTWRTTTVVLVEHMDPEPIYYDLADFWALVDKGKLIEVIPEQLHSAEARLK